MGQRVAAIEDGGAFPLAFSNEGLYTSEQQNCTRSSGSSVARIERKSDGIYTGVPEAGLQQTLQRPTANG